MEKSYIASSWAHGDTSAIAESFLSVLEISGDAIVAIDLAMKILIFNRGAEEIFGFTSDAILGKHLNCILPERFQAEHHAHVERFHQSGEQFRYMNRRSTIWARRKNGEEFPAEASISKVTYKGNPIFVVVLRDISGDVALRQEIEQRKAVEADLRDERERLRKMLANEKFLSHLGNQLSSSKNFAVDLLEIQKEVAKRFRLDSCILLKYSLKDREFDCVSSYPEEDCEKIFTDTDMEWLKEKIHRREKVIELDTKRKRKKVSPIEGVWSFFCYPTELTEDTLLVFYAHRLDSASDYEITYIIETVANLISGAFAKDYQFQARLEAEQQQAEAVRILEKSSHLASIGIMAAGVTHEISQPLNAIKVTADSVLFWEKRNQGIVPEMFVDKLKKISDGSNRIREIIAHMRSFWVDSTTQQQSIIDFQKAVQNSLSLIERQLYSHQIKPLQNFTKEKLMVKGSSVNLEQIVINLVINAMHSIDEAKRSHKELAMETFIEEGKGVLKVSDNGTGLPNIDRERLFDPFYSTKKPGEGMGLGLAIVKSFVERLGGEIDARNNSSEGATFMVRIPLVVE